MRITPTQYASLDPCKSFWIEASAGSGKTRTLVYRMVRLLLTDHRNPTQIGIQPSSKRVFQNPARILCLTFTKKAAMEIKERLLEVLGWFQDSSLDDLSAILFSFLGCEATDYQRSFARELVHLVLASPPAIHTFHSFCHDLLLLHGSGAIRVLEETQASALWQQAYGQAIASIQAHSPLGQSVLRLARCHPKFWETLRAHPAAGEAEWEQGDRESLLSAIFPHYVALKGEALDFDDILLQALSLFQKPSSEGWVTYSLYQSLDHVLVDESQDTNLPQWSLFRQLVETLLWDPRKTFFVVGDSKQSIYSFQGANLATFFAMKHFTQQWIKSHGGKFEALEFTLTFRSSRAIVDVVNTLFSTLSLTTELFPIHSSYVKAFGWVELRSPTSAQAWSHQLKEWLDQPFYLPTCRRFLQATDIMILFPRRSSFFHEFQRILHENGLWKGGIQHHPILQILLCIGRWLLHPQDDEALGNVVKNYFSKGSWDPLFSLAHDRGGHSLWEQIQIHKDRWPILWKGLQTWREWRMLHAPFALFSCIIHQGLPFFQSFPGWQQAVDSFMDQLYPWEWDLAGFLSWMEKNPSLSQPSGDGIQMMTIHGAKGLESPVVILPDLPAPLGKETPEYWRLLYVAMTRARDRLYCSPRPTTRIAKGWYPTLLSSMKHLGLEGPHGLYYGEEPRCGSSVA